MDMSLHMMVFLVEKKTMFNIKYDDDDDNNNNRDGVMKLEKGINAEIKRRQDADKVIYINFYISFFKYYST